MRYLIGNWALKSFGDSFPYGTLIANVFASILIGLILEGSTNAWNLSPTTKLLLTTGLLGGLSTFSTFSYQTVTLLNNSFILGSLNIITNLFLSLLGVVLGKYIINIF
ncbi:CrcB family protein [Caldisalinibacter kiritimatiensis]|uniref:CrcB family protein n=1 Tax=Caldisalinibacter kiritimatiensis TaxID=1304284 RepID=UPI003BF95C6C